MYYGFNKNIISDYLYDKFSFNLTDLIKQYPDKFKQSAYYKDFKDFDPSTGLRLNFKNKPEIINVAN